MSKAKGGSTNKAAVDHVVKRTYIGGLRPKTSSMNKSYRRSYKASRGQGR
jgi:hypothetical protein